jgi:hypothetical protein
VLHPLTVPRACFFCAAIAVIIVAAGANQARADSLATLRIDVLPRGSVIELEGPQHTLTASPNTIPRPVSGWYRLKASHAGYENWKSRIYIDASTPTGVTGSLSAKTRTKAGLRSIFFPGWGQYYSGRNSRGAFLTIATLGMLGGYLYFDNRADNYVSDYESLQQQYDQAESVEDQEQLLGQVQQAQREAYDAETDKRNWGYATLGVYLYQILDAIIFFPEPERLEIGGVKFGVEAPDPESVMIGARYEF